MGIYQELDPEEDGDENEPEDDLEEEDDDWYGNTICPECGSEDLKLVDSTEDGDEYTCNDCGERFVEGEEDDE